MKEERTKENYEDHSPNEGSNVDRLQSLRGKMRKGGNTTDEAAKLKVDELLQTEDKGGRGVQVYLFLKYIY